MKSIVFSHKGNRKINQDFVLVNNINSDTYLFLIADGMGGYEHGEIAAKMVAENILTYLLTVAKIDEAHIQKGVNKANLAIRQYQQQQNIKMGATIGGILLSSDKATCFWVGDVKIMHFRNGNLIKESESHTLKNELKNSGSFANASQTNKYNHIVTRSVQGQVELSHLESFKVDKIYESDLLILCSDGVHNEVSGLKMQYIFKTHSYYNEGLLQIQNYLEEHGKDNYSLIAVGENINHSN